MGWGEYGYVKIKGGKITKLKDDFNDLLPNEVREAINKIIQGRTNIYHKEDMER